MAGSKGSAILTCGEIAVRNNSGYALVIVLFVCAITTTLAISLLNVASSEYMMGCYARDYTMAYYLAEAGVQEALSALKNDPYYRGANNWKALGEGRYKTKIASKGTDSLTVTSTGKVRKAEAALTVYVDLYIETDPEIYPDPPYMNTEIRVTSWDFYGPI